MGLSIWKIPFTFPIAWFLNKKTDQPYLNELTLNKSVSELLKDTPLKMQILWCLLTEVNLKCIGIAEKL